MAGIWMFLMSVILILKMNLDNIHYKLGVFLRSFADNPAMVFLAVAGGIALLVVGGIVVDALMVKVSARLQLNREKARAKLRASGQWPLAR
jgi:hypothetical protein